MNICLPAKERIVFKNKLLLSDGWLLNKVYKNIENIISQYTTNEGIWCPTREGSMQFSMDVEDKLLFVKRKVMAEE